MIIWKSPEYLFAGALLISTPVLAVDQSLLEMESQRLQAAVSPAFSSALPLQSHDNSDTEIPPPEGRLERLRTRASLLDQVDDSWVRPRVFQRESTDVEQADQDLVRERLEAVLIARVGLVFRRLFIRSAAPP